MGMSGWRNGCGETEGGSSEWSHLSPETHDKENTQVNTHPRVYTVGKLCKILLKPQNNFINKNFADLFSTEEESGSSEASLLLQEFLRRQGCCAQASVIAGWFGDCIGASFTPNPDC